MLPAEIGGFDPHKLSDVLVKAASVHHAREESEQPRRQH